jgi:PPOX class probable F420-dependent enzyme
VRKLTEKQQQFLETPFVGVVTTLRPDGSPHSTIVWVDVEDGIPSFNTALGRVKPTNLEQDARASLVVVDPNDSYHWLSVDGHAELTTDGAEEQIDKLARKYTEHESYPWRVEGQVRVTVRIAPEHVTAYGIE